MSITTLCTHCRIPMVTDGKFCSEGCKNEFKLMRLHGESSLDIVIGKAVVPGRSKDDNPPEWILPGRIVTRDRNTACIAANRIHRMMESVA